MYHFGDNYVAIGFVVHLNYKNPWLSPFDEFQRFKTHPAVRRTWKAASASPMARAPSRKAAGSPCRS
jgi:flavin-dependent dehydrogenase